MTTGAPGSEIWMVGTVESAHTATLIGWDTSNALDNVRPLSATVVLADDGSRLTISASGASFDVSGCAFTVFEGQYFLPPP
jgi:hypothetical protein